MSARKTFLCIHAYVYVFLLEALVYGDLPKPFPCIVKTNIEEGKSWSVFLESRWTNNEHGQKFWGKNIPGNQVASFLGWIFIRENVIEKVTR